MSAAVCPNTDADAPVRPPLSSFRAIDFQYQRQDQACPSACWSFQDFARQVAAQPVDHHDGMNYIGKYSRGKYYSQYHIQLHSSSPLL